MPAEQIRPLCRYIVCATHDATRDARAHRGQTSLGALDRASGDELLLNGPELDARTGVAFAGPVCDLHNRDRGARRAIVQALARWPQASLLAPLSRKPRSVRCAATAGTFGWSDQVS